MTITFRPAVREDVGLIIGLAGPSGSGKTFSALRLAAGMSQGKRFAVIDTEAGRSKHYADRFAFDHADLQPPFRPSSYADAIKAADAAGYPVIVVDSFSHEHAGEGGLLDWHEEELTRIAKDDWKKREACKMTAWIKPKTDHKRMVQRLLQVRAHLILCFRAEQKVDIVRNSDGGMQVQPKKIASGFSDWIPICEKNLLFELTASFLLTPDHPGIPKPIKLEAQHRAVMNLSAPLDEQAGKKLAEWAKGGQAIPAPAQALQAAAQELAGEPVDITIQEVDSHEEKVNKPFIWRVGKLPDQGGHKGKNIDDIPLDYLEWYAQKGTLADHRNAAQAAIDWAKGQQSLGSEDVA